MSKKIRSFRWDKKEWDPRRRFEAWQVYKAFDAFLAKNPQINANKAIDMAICHFLECIPALKTLLAADLVTYQPNWQWVEKYIADQKKAESERRNEEVS